ncbi:MAG TPA: exopolyphosphatase, partial [Acidimicrobiales bacterium]|nr:exopolyphosphatase [Acidimicrobiales bacterium]
VLVVDIGGGSTELVVRGRHGLGVVSLDLGCVRLSERYLGHDPPHRDELASAERVTAGELARAVTAVPDLDALPPDSRLLGLAGTVSTLAALELGLTTYDRDRIHHFVLTLDAVRRWCEVLAAEPAARRAARPGMIEGRQDVIVGGALVLRQVMETLGFDRCTVSESDILDGLVESLVE